MTPEQDRMLRSIHDALLVSGSGSTPRNTTFADAVEQLWTLLERMPNTVWDKKYPKLDDDDVVNPAWAWLVGANMGAWSAAGGATPHPSTPPTPQPGPATPTAPTTPTTQTAPPNAEPKGPVTDYAVSVVRTVVPSLWGALIGLLVAIGLLPTSWSAQAVTLGTAVLVPFFVSLVYAVARWLEGRSWFPTWASTLLLGSAKRPSYAGTGGVRDARAG
ncbi:hypothetical protein F0L68_30665 [Solihabitans fulvus]|uniref:Uncharacterized protein n=1 Tax=Solihabitans fulvus TaxID=1892852 RepID=A0A5B2WTV4_9PSEU|nr:hypothetical protein [Solihabitans fulvus]KAA2254290.1 hypothetical protein F0L68_30665 [Solihabitans fulvus]